MSNAGGRRPGAGRPAGTVKKAGRPKGTTATATAKNDFGFNVIKEQIALYKKLKKSSDPKALALMASLLKDIAPYLEKKQPTAPTHNEDNTPTTIEIVDINPESDEGGIV